MIHFRCKYKWPILSEDILLLTYQNIKISKSMSDFTSTKICLSCSTAPPAIGPYSHVVRAEGLLIYVSGCLGLAPESFTGWAEEYRIYIVKFFINTYNVQLPYVYSRLSSVHCALKSFLFMSSYVM